MAFNPIQNARDLLKRFQPVASSLSNFVNQYPSPASFVQQKINPPVVSPLPDRQPLQNNYNLMQRFASTPVARGITSVQNRIESPQPFRPIPNLVSPQGNYPLARTLLNIPSDIGNAVIGGGVLNPATDIGRMVGKTLRGEMLPEYNTLKSGATRLGYQIAGEPTAKQGAKEILANLASTIEAPATIYGGGKVFGMGKAIVKAPALTVLKTIWEGMKTGGKYGAGFGMIQGLQSAKDIDDNLKYLLNVGTNVGTGTVGGAVLGGGTAWASRMVGGFLKATQIALGKHYPNLTPVESEARSYVLLRNELGQFAGIGKKEPIWVWQVNMTPGERAVDNAKIRAIRKELGLPDNYQSGAINFGAEIGGKAPKEAGQTGLVPQIDNLTSQIQEYVKQGKTPPIELINQVNALKAKLRIKPVSMSGVRTREIMPDITSPLGGGGVKPVPTLPQIVQTQKAVPKGNLPLQVSSEVIDSSRPIIPQVANPTNPYFNINRLNIKPEVKKALKVVVEETKPQIEKVVGKTLSNKEVVETANRTAKVLRKVATRQETLNWEASMLKARQLLAEQAQSGKVTPEYIDSLVQIKSQGTDIARKLQSLGIGADPQQVTAKQVMLESILKQTDKVDEVLKAAGGVDFNDFKQATEFYRKFIKPTREEWLDTLRYNAMLSSPNTHLVNISSNYQGTGLIAPIEKTLTGTFDWIGSAVSGKPRQYYAGEGIEYAKGYYSNLGKAAKRFSDVLTGKAMGEYPELRNIPLATKGGKKAAENFLKFPQRALEAMDQFFTTLTSAGSTKALEHRVSKGVKVADIAGQAGREASKRLFRSGFGLPEEGLLLKAIEYIPSKLMEAKNATNPIVKWTAKLSFPFVRIAVNLFKQGIEYSPAGLATILGAKEKLPQFTKAFMGSMVGVGAAMLASSDRITWAKPTGSKQQDLWNQAGLQEYSVKIGDKWVSYTKLHPLLAFNLATVAGVKSAWENQKISDGTADTMLTSLWNVMRFYADQSYVKNIGDFIGVTQEGVSALPKLVSNYWQQFVPYRAFMGWLARVLDPVQRGTTPDANMIQKQMEYFFMQIPGIRQTLPVKTGVTGEPIENQNRFLNAFSPARVTTGQPDYEGAYYKYKNQGKLNDLKKEAMKLYSSGNIEGAKKIATENKINITKGDINTYKVGIIKKAADLYVLNNVEGAKKLATDNNVTLTKGDVAKAAKRKAVELYKLGLIDQAKKIADQYNIIVTRKDVE